MEHKLKTIEDLKKENKQLMDQLEDTRDEYDRTNIFSLIMMNRSLISKLSRDTSNENI